MNDELSIALSVAVPLCIEQMKSLGGPSTSDFVEAAKFGRVLSEKGDILLFGGRKKGETANMFNKTAKSIAVLSFCPGGIELFGCHFEAKHDAE